MKLDPNAALVVIDLQAGVVALPVPEMPTVIANSVRLVHAWRAAGRPVVLVNVTGGPGGRSALNPAGGAREIGPEAAALIPELGRHDGDLLITKRTRGAFHGTSLEADLAALGVTQIVLTGVATGSGVEETGREGFARGLNIAYVADAMADMDAEIHDLCLRKILPKQGELATTDEVLALL